MEYVHRYIAQFRNRLAWLLVLNNVLVIVVWTVCYFVLGLEPIIAGTITLAVVASAVFILPILATRLLAQPSRLIAEAILHLNPQTAEQIPLPDARTAKYAKQMVATLIHDVYELATAADRLKLNEDDIQKLIAGFIADNLPVPLIILDNKQQINYVNSEATRYVAKPAEELVGKDFATALSISYTGENTYDSWLQNARMHKATDSGMWERVRMKLTDDHPMRIFDLAAYYNKDNPRGIETILVLFDHTASYSQDDQAVSFIALTVHELRTPLTLLRGYIEAFEDELGDTLEPEMRDFMFKMSATAQQLTSFVNNILNVARIDGEQLELQMQEVTWGDIVRSAANALALRAKVRGISIEYSIAPDLPTVGADRMRINEVIDNLVDNAIKYSGQATKIKITAKLNSEGLVETTVQDYGVGITNNIIPHLFTKFYRDHHHRAQVGGTGLGLYLCKAIVSAHGGSIWVTSKQGEGSTFGFTLIPYSQIKQAQETSSSEIVHRPHGWIKNHSLYRQ